MRSMKGGGGEIGHCPGGLQSRFLVAIHDHLKFLLPNPNPKKGLAKKKIMECCFRGAIILRANEISGQNS